MFRIVAAILCLLWSVCSVKCAAELMLGDRCDHASETCCGGESSGVPGTLCKTMFHDGLWTFQATGLASLFVLLLITVALLPGGRWLVELFSVRSPLPSEFRLLVPPDVRPHWTLMLRGAMPVRGPNVLVG